jgi:hypothetical protein
MSWIYRLVPYQVMVSFASVIGTYIGTMYTLLRFRTETSKLKSQNCITLIDELQFSFRLARTNKKG